LVRSRICDMWLRVNHVGMLAAMGQIELDEVRKIALALPEVNERLSHGALCFFIQDRRPLCYYHDNHRGDGRVSLWCPVRPGARDEMVAAEPKRYFKPPTSAAGTFENWLGVFLDTPELDWREIAAIVEEAFRRAAPKRLVAELDER
jgi:hypothetical protein